LALLRSVFNPTTALSAVAASVTVMKSFYEKQLQGEDRLL
jgi:hypothetical protein